MLDVHPPHSPIHSWRDFLIQLFTITVGLLIALALEGAVEWLHHRHVMHQAQASLYNEIRINSGKAQAALDALHAQQKALQRDVAILSNVIAHPDLAMQDPIDVNFSIKTFANVSWKTAEATGALTLMPYALAEQYSAIYGGQDKLDAVELQAARDATMGIAPFLNLAADDSKPTGEEAALMKSRIEVLQGQLLLVDSYLRDMDTKYKQYLAQHVE